jgi:choline dehydrogenase-like flavoprotein/predicted dehydrogenase
MKIFDLDQLEDSSVIDTDLCIVGSGPAGMSIASEFARTNTRVLVLESGGLSDEPDTQVLYEIENIGAQRSVNQDQLRRRILGGSSHIWTGRCAPFDALDFERRPWVPHSGWPLKRAELEPYLARAGNKLGLGPHRYDETLWEDFRVDRPRPPLDERFLRQMFWQFSKSPYNRTAMHFGRDLVDAEAPNVEILLHANVVRINVANDSTRFDSVDVSTVGGRQARVRSKALALCCGGIENARLLLASRHQLPSGVGNQHDLVGRYLMDHTNGAIGHFDVRDADDVRSRFGHYWLDDDQGRHVFLHGLALSADVQQSEGLLNCHAYIEELDGADDDPWAALRRLYSSVRARKIVGSDARIALTHSEQLLRGLYRRQFKHRPQLAPMKRIELNCILEQVPDPESRVTLSHRCDALGMPLSKINWKINDAERRAVKRMGQLIYGEFKRLGLPVPLGIVAMENEEDWITRCVEKAHPAGTTRMSDNPNEGVVDANCKVHSISGLYIAGSSVFPTSGAANPTLMIVAMALRLADHLKVQFKANDAPTPVTFPSLRERYRGMRTTQAAAQLKIGFVGAGQRISDLYFPIIEAQPEKYKMVGFTARSSGGAHRFESKTGICSFASARDLVERARPDLLIVAVSDRMSESTILNLLDLNVPILAETPLAWSAAAVRKIIDKATANRVTVGVAEQFPLLPLEQFRQQLIKAGVFGDVYATFNNFHSYSYHGIAQLRRYLKGKPIHARSSDFDFEPGIKLQTGSVAFDDGAVLVHHYADAHPWKSVCLCGTLGSMQDYEIRLGDRTVLVARKEQSPAHLESLSADLPDIGNVTWSNPFVAHAFTDEQIAVAATLDSVSHSVRDGTAPPYGAHDFLTDIEIIQAFRYSAARNDVAVPLPLQERLQKAAMLTSRSYWRRKLSARKNRGRAGPT